MLLATLQPDNIMLIERISQCNDPEDLMQFNHDVLAMNDDQFELYHNAIEERTAQINAYRAKMLDQISACTSYEVLRSFWPIIHQIKDHDVFRVFVKRMEERMDYIITFK